MPKGTNPDQALTVQPEQLAGSTVVLRVRGELDLATAPRLQAAITTQIDNQPERLIVHLGGVTFLGTAGLGVLVEAARRRPDLRLLVTDRIRRTLELSGLKGWFNVYATVTDALCP